MFERSQQSEYATNVTFKHYQNKQRLINQSQGLKNTKTNDESFNLNFQMMQIPNNFSNWVIFSLKYFGSLPHNISKINHNSIQ